MKNNEYNTSKPLRGKKKVIRKNYKIKCLNYKRGWA